MTPTIPTPQDSRLLMQDTVTKTASYNTPALDLGAGYAPGGPGQGVSAVLAVVSRDISSGDETYGFVLQESPDNVTFSPAGAAASVTAAGVMLARGVIRTRFVRLALSVAGTTPSIVFKAWLNPLPG